MQPHILIVDDEPAVLDTIRALVERAGCGVVAMTDSRQAAERLNTEKFDGVFLDIRMPNLDGFELAKRVRASEVNGSIPIVMFTALDDVASMREGFRAGATCFLGKPVSPDRIATLLKALRGAMLGEGRRPPRLPLRVVVRCRIGDRLLKAKSAGISESGMVLDAPGPWELGQELTLEFLMPKATAPTQVRVRVVSQEPSGSIAVSFLDLSPAQRELIQRYIDGARAR